MLRQRVSPHGTVLQKRRNGHINSQRKIEVTATGGQPVAFFRFAGAFAAQVDVERTVGIVPERVAVADGVAANGVVDQITFAVVNGV